MVHVLDFCSAFVTNASQHSYTVYSRLSGLSSLCFTAGVWQLCEGGKLIGPTDVSVWW